MSGREKWLLAILTGVFVVQASTLVYGVHICSTAKIPIQTCPKLGERFDNTFATMIATTLALLTGSAVAATSKPRTTKPKAPPPGRT